MNTEHLQHQLTIYLFSKDALLFERACSAFKLYEVNLSVFDNEHLFLDASHQAPPDFLLLDIHQESPIFHAIQSDELKHLPIMLLIEESDWMDFQTCFSSQAIQFETKPIYFPALLHRIQQSVALSNVQHTLRKNEEHYRLIVRNSLDAIITIDENSIITGWNGHAERIFGWHSEEIIGLTLYQTIMPSQFRGAHKKGLNHFKQTGEGPVLNQRLKLTAVRRNGEEFPIEIAISPLHIGSGYAFSAFVRDISEREKLEQMRRDFIATVSHELRTPMAAILGYSDTLLKKSPGPLTEIQKEFLQTIHASGNKLKYLVDDLLTVTRLEEGRERVNKTTFDLTTIIAQIIQNFELKADDNQIQFTNNFSSQNSWQIEADQHRFEQILNNLLSNAFKFTPQGGQISLEVCFKEANTTLPQLNEGTPVEGYVVAVSDNGIGIPKEDLPHLFDRFHRSKNAIDGAIEGTGLGLHIAKEFTDLHQGHIWVESQLGQGSRFAFWLPKAHRESQK